MAAKKFDGGLGKKIAKAYKSGVSGPAISAKFKVTVSTVYYYLRLLNVKRRARSVAATKKATKRITKKAA